MVLGCLSGTPLREHSDYLMRRKRLHLRPPTTLTRDNGLLAALRRAAPKTKSRQAQKNAWILAATWRLVNERVSALRKPARDQALIRRLGCAINSILKGGWIRRTEEAGEEV